MKDKIKTVGDLIVELQKQDPNSEIFLYNGEFMYGGVMNTTDISKTQVYDDNRHGGVRIKEDWDGDDTTSLTHKNVRDAVILGYEVW